jgi:hypothetical protein
MVLEMGGSERTAYFGVVRNGGGEEARWREGKMPFLFASFLTAGRGRKLQKEQEHRHRHWCTAQRTGRGTSKEDDLYKMFLNSAN